MQRSVILKKNFSYYLLFPHPPPPGVFIFRISPFFTFKVLRFESDKGVEFVLMLGKCVIGKKLPGKDYWEIRRPFRLLVNEREIGSLEN